MNPTSPVTTGAAAISGAMIGGVIVWLCTVARMTPPPADVAMTLGAVTLTAGHAAVNWLNRRFPPVDTSPAKQSAPASSADAPAKAAGA